MSDIKMNCEQISVIKNKQELLSVPSLTIDSGKTTGIVGPNGAGKTTLLKVLALLEQPEAGRLFYDGKQVWPGKITLSERRRVSVMFQQPLMFDTNVFKNVATPLKFQRKPSNYIKQQVHFWLKQFGVEHLSRQRARWLSGGEAQRIALARAFVQGSEVLLLDEPFSALDWPTRKKLLRDFKQNLSETKMTTIFVSHDYQDILYLCDEVIFIHGGAFVKKVNISYLQDGSFDDLPIDFKRFIEDWVSPLRDDSC